MDSDLKPLPPVPEHLVWILGGGSRNDPKCQKSDKAWKTIDSAPKDGRDVLVYCADTKEQMVAFCMGDTWQFAYFAPHNVQIVCRPTHWMELPDPPK